MFEQGMMMPCLEAICWHLRDNPDWIFHRIKLEGDNWQKKDLVPPFPTKANLLIAKSYSLRYHNAKLWDLLKVNDGSMIVGRST